MAADYPDDFWVDDMYQTLNLKSQREGINEEEGIILTAGFLTAEVCNGGFRQYALYLPKDFAWGEYAGALEAIGAKELASIVRRSDALLQAEYDPEEGLSSEDAVAQVEQLDNEYFACRPGHDDVIDRMYDLIMAHRDRFPDTTDRENRMEREGKT